MLELWAVLGPILVADALNPVLFAFVIYAAGTELALLNASLLLAGHTTAYFGAGIVLALLLERLRAILESPGTVALGVQLLLGLVLLGVAFLSRTDRGRPEPSGRAEPTSPWRAFATGMVVNFVGIPFAIPYFAALDQILAADLDAAGAVLQIAIYNLAYALPFASVVAIRAALGDGATPLLERINHTVVRVGDVVMPPLLGLVGLALVVDAILWLGWGVTLFAP